MPRRKSVRKAFGPRKAPSQARAKVTWNTILDGAAQVLVKQGYEKSTTDRIAERAGVSVGSVYEYFPNKEAIFASLVLRWNEQRWQAFLDARNDGTYEEAAVGLEGAIRATVRARIEAARINPKLNDALRRVLPPKITDDQARQMHDVFLEATVDTLKRFVSKKRDLDLMGELMIHSTQAVVEVLGATRPELLEAPELEEELVTMMMSYVES
jgi:AcrR family transcriptional regulator